MRALVIREAFFHRFSLGVFRWSKYTNNIHMLLASLMQMLGQELHHSSLPPLLPTHPTIHIIQFLRLWANSTKLIITSIHVQQMWIEVREGVTYKVTEDLALNLGTLNNSWLDLSLNKLYNHVQSHINTYKFYRKRYTSTVYVWKIDGLLNFNHKTPVIDSSIQLQYF